jgi:hypothetical protein
VQQQQQQKQQKDFLFFSLQLLRIKRVVLGSTTSSSSSSSNNNKWVSFLNLLFCTSFRIKRAEAVAATRGLLLSFFLFRLLRNQKSINLGSSRSNTNN